MLKNRKTGRWTWDAVERTWDAVGFSIKLSAYVPIHFFLISTTHGGETNAIRAGIKTIQEFKDKDVIEHIHDKEKNKFHVIKVFKVL